MLPLAQLPERPANESRALNAPASHAEDDPAALVMDESGTIIDCNESAETLFGFPRAKLISRHISLLLPRLADFELVQNGEINPRLKLLCRIGWLFKVRAGDRTQFYSRLFLSHPGNAQGRRVRLIAQHTGTPIQPGSPEHRPPLRKHAKPFRPHIAPNPAAAKLRAHS